MCSAYRLALPQPLHRHAQACEWGMSIQLDLHRSPDSPRKKTFEDNSTLEGILGKLIRQGQGDGLSQKGLGRPGIMLS